MMKLTVAFLATLAAADAAQAHGRRHVRRQYGAAPPYSLPGTGYLTETALPESSSSAAVPSSSGLPYNPSSGTAPASSSAAVPSSSGMPYNPSSGTAPAYPAYPTSSVAMPAESGAYGTGFPTTGGPAVPTGYNGTELVTSTRYSTMTLTVTACPAYGDCPSESTQIVTSVVPVGTTAYPKPTGDDYEVIESSVSEITHTMTETLTYTVGVGENAHPTTKEITSCSTETVYETMTVSKDHASPTGAYPEGDDEITGTTTLTTTSTTTRYITVRPTPSETAKDNEAYPTGPSNEAYPTGPSNEEGECEALPPVTVTVTAQETVTVTAGQEYPTAGQEYPTSVAYDNEVPTSSAAVVTEYPTSSEAIPSEKPTSVVTVSVVPYPIGNGTTPQYPTGSSGFLTSTKQPSGTAPADSYLPSFTLPASSSYAMDNEVPSSSYAVPTAVPSDSYGPGYRF